MLSMLAVVPGGESLERGPALLLILGLATIAAGAVRYVHLGHFSWPQAVYCLVSIPAALLLLMLADYTLHHARIVFLMVLAIFVLLGIASPSFCVGLGVGLTGMVLTQFRR
jgi:cell division protein FtsW (lipid II flippase)